MASTLDKSPDHPHAADVMVPADLQVSDHTVVDKALDILHSAHVEHLLVRGDDGHCVGLVTRDDLSGYLSQPWYSQHTRLRDLVRPLEPFAHPDTPIDAVAEAMRDHGAHVWPVVDADGFALGVITAEQLGS
ncbi:CBS domain-containing protein [Streptacidiphilus melanogenes]|uniref:CBS domain-containing protein n=1 Tax=Streptacidiphilus melanogenes TaxID=411235 RepID=UPI0005A9F745|nr:CBS domain-containing protein [Streptacidiphilus melanogenes]